jgi:hypothetical protein
VCAHISRLADKTRARRYVNIYLKTVKVFRGRDKCRRNKILPQGQPCAQHHTPRNGMRRAYICITSMGPPCARPRIAILLAGMPESISAWISRLVWVVDWLNPFLSSGEALSESSTSLYAGTGNPPIWGRVK